MYKRQEDVEMRLPPTEPTEPASQGKQSDKPEQTGEINFQETMNRKMMEMFLQFRKEMKEHNE